MFDIKANKYMQNNLVNLILSKPEYPEIVKKELARITGLSIETINRYCRNKNSAIDARVAILMADYFGCSVQDLYSKVYAKTTRKLRKQKTKSSIHHK